MAGFMNYANLLRKFILFFLTISISFSSLTVNGNSLKSSLDFSRSRNQLSVFLDLQRWADEDYIRQEIPMVDYVRDKEMADVHIIMTRHQSGSAGSNYVISFIGGRQFEGMNNELNFWAPASMTRHEVREGYTNMIKIGLAPYIANVEDMLGMILLDFDTEVISLTDPLTEEEDDDDPWNRWIFEIYGGGNFSKEESRSSINFRYGFYADKVTEEWKIRIRPYFNYNERNFVVGDSTVTSISHRDGFNGYLIKSLTDHWSAGIFTNMLSSTFHNMDFQMEVSPAIEYSLYPYREATRRSITFTYRVGYAHNNYIEETIFEKTKESLFGHALNASANFRQPWGDIRAGITGSQYFHDFRANRAEFFARLNLRIFKGFSLSLRGGFDLINDLVSIPMGDLSPEEILLEQRRQATDYEISGNIGLTYTFGSELSGAYNPRL